MTVQRRSLLLVLALLAFAPALAAQFTTLVLPAPADAPHRVQARSDTLRRTDSILVARRITDMRAWVDSAALAMAAKAPDSVGTAPGADSLARGPKPAPAVAAVKPAAKPAASPTTFQNGAPAPATATTLPLITLIGVGAVLFGSLLKRST